MMSPYRFSVFSAACLWSPKYAWMARSMVILDGSSTILSGAGVGSDSAGQRPPASQRSATWRASDQSKRPVLRLRRILAMDPAAMIGQPHRFHVLLRSWNSPLVDHRSEER